MKTILIVDDNEQNRYLLQALFSGHGYALSIAADGVEAMEKARQQLPDLIITDILMPRMDGYTLCRQWKADETLKRIPLLFYTGTYTDPVDRQFALDLGADRFILKPAEPEVLLAVVEEVMGEYQVAQQPSRSKPALEEAVYFKQYNETLIRKLEDKLVELEIANARLHAEAAERKRAERLLESRLKLIEYAVDHPLEECLREALREIGQFVNSPIGFYYCMESDQQRLALQQWSAQTLEEFRAEVHDAAGDTGIWADCARSRESVIRNKGESADSPRAARQLAVPIIRQDKVVAILGVGHKPTEYTQDDAKVVSFLADVTWTIVEHKLAEEAVFTVHERLQRFVNASIVGVFIADAAGEVIEANDFYLNLIGATQDDVKARRVNWLAVTPPEAVAADVNAVREMHEHGTCTPYEKEYVHRDGRRVSVLLAGAMLPGPEEQIAAFVVDLTERKNLEGQLRQAQKMEAVGQLADGVAHDFNNILQAIFAYSQMLLDKLPEHEQEREHEYVQEILNAAERAAALVRQLLTFSRRQVLQTRDLNINDVIGNVSKMIKRLLGEHIQLHVVPGGGLWTVHADAGQLEQVLLNLCVNARDAMPEGGVITIKTENIILDAEYAARNTLAMPGHYVRLSVTDDGCGMSNETIQRVFEPFFTTKEAGRGTGLGLATVYGIVKQHGGMIQVDSEPGHGATFEVLLPAVERPVAARQADKEAPPQGGSETILVVEDDRAVRGIIVDILTRAGYVVLVAENGNEALHLYERMHTERGRRIELILSDIVMPALGGKGVYEHLKNSPDRPRFLFSSGYSGNTAYTGFVLQEGVELLSKPYTPNDLLRKVRGVLDKPRGS